MVRVETSYPLPHHNYHGKKGVVWAVIKHENGWWWEVGCDGGGWGSNMRNGAHRKSSCTIATPKGLLLKINALPYC